MLIRRLNQAAFSLIFRGRENWRPPTDSARIQRPGLGVLLDDLVRDFLREICLTFSAKHLPPL